MNVAVFPVYSFTKITYQAENSVKHKIAYDSFIAKYMHYISAENPTESVIDISNTL